MKVAIVIPCRNEQANIEECITAICNSDLPNHIEVQIYVVDGLSDDKTIEILNQLQLNHKNLTVISNDRKLTPFAFNLGIEAGLADCDYFQIVGARQIISTNYISDAIRKIESDSSIWCIGGQVENVYLNPTSKIIARVMETSFGMGLGNFRTLESSGFVDTVGTPMYPKHVFDKIGYFDEELIRNQDDDFNYRVLKAGGKIYFDADISLKYYVRGNFKNLWKQFFQYGYWKVYVNKKHGAITTLRQLVPPLFVLYLIFLLVTALISFKVFCVLVIPLVGYFAMALYFTMGCLKKDREMSFLKVLQTFPILHLSYGFGYLRGFVEFVLLGRGASERQKEISR